MLKDDNGVNVPAMLEDQIGSIREKYLEMNSVYQIPFNPRYSSMIFTEQGKESIPVFYYLFIFYFSCFLFLFPVLSYDFVVYNLHKE